MESYKGRYPERGKPVEVYRNIHRGGYSIRQNGLVVAHASHVRLEKCQMCVNHNGRKKVIESGQKNVHAWIKGTIVDNYSDGAEGRRLARLTYNPYRDTGFTLENGSVSLYASYVWLSEDGAYALLPGEKTCST